MKEALAFSENGKKSFKKKEFAAAADWFAKAAAAYDTCGDTLLAAEEKNNLSVALLMAGEPQRALEAALHTDEVFAVAGDRQRQAIALANQASACQDIKDNQRALNLFEEASELLKALGEEDMRSEILKKISILQLKEGQQLQAVSSYSSAVSAKPHKGLKEHTLKALFKALFNFFR